MNYFIVFLTVITGHLIWKIIEIMGSRYTKSKFDQVERKTTKQLEVKEQVKMILAEGSEKRFSVKPDNERTIHKAISDLMEIEPELGNTLQSIWWDWEKARQLRENAIKKEFAKMSDQMVYDLVAKVTKAASDAKDLLAALKKWQ